jgi:hypothetical protein
VTEHKRKNRLTIKSQEKNKRKKLKKNEDEKKLSFEGMIEKGINKKN